MQTPAHPTIGAAAIAAFSAALPALTLAPHASGAFLPLTFSIGSIPYNTNDGVTLFDGALSIGSFAQFNDNSGRTMQTNGFGLNGLAAVPYSAVIDAGLSFVTQLDSGNAAIFSTGVTGTQTVAFRTALNNYGWIRFSVTDGGPLIYDAAAYNDAGAPISAGKLSLVPLPATLPLAALGVLALGAAGLRRKRKARAAA